MEREKNWKRWLSVCLFRKQKSSCSRSLPIRTRNKIGYCKQSILFPKTYVPMKSNIVALRRIVIYIAWMTIGAPCPNIVMQRMNEILDFVPLKISSEHRCVYVCVELFFLQFFSVLLPCRRKKSYWKVSCNILAVSRYFVACRRILPDTKAIV